MSASSDPLPTPRVSTSARFVETLSDLPWWFLIILLGGIFFTYNVFTDETYGSIFNILKDGVWITIQVTITAYVFALFLGLITGLGRVSSNPVFYNLATLYVQIMRGLPILVTILYVAFVITPLMVAMLNGFGDFLSGIGLLSAENWFSSLSNRQISLQARGTLALAVSYGAFSAEIFRAGIQSIGKGQMEAARSLGMSYFEAMRYIILPQAIRRVLPPLGNDFIAILKESSLVSFLGVNDITQLSKLYAARSFLYLETYSLLAYMYLVMTILLSFVVKFIETRMSTDAR